MSVDLKNFTLNRGPNPNAQFTVGNVVAFADAAGSAPVDGTGGAPTCTIARSVSSPLDGIASYLFTKDAANRQGEGFSTDIALQPSDATKVMSWSFDYQISTGTYTGYQAPPLYSDLTLWVYDVTNSVMYQADGYQIDGAVSSTNQYSLSASWQVPVGCLTARLIWFLGNTTANAFTAKFNNISFGRLPIIGGTESLGSFILRGTPDSLGGSTSGETQVLNFSVAITSTGSDITFTARTTTTADKYTINTTGIYCVWFTARSTTGLVAGITLNSTGLSTAPSSLTANQLIAGCILNSGTTNGNSVTLKLLANDIIRVQSEGTSANFVAADYCRFGIARVG